MPSIDVLDSTIFYEDAGSGTPFVFLHGNPTSSYLWRQVSPHIGEPTRCLAPDLIGMGRSGKPDIPYRFADHARYLDAWFDALELTSVVLVGHDWGGALAFDWAARHPDRVRGIAFMETIMRPMSWDDLPNARPRYEALRSPGSGEAKVLDENFFIEQALRATVLNGLSDEDHAVYRAALPNPRKPAAAAGMAARNADRGRAGRCRRPDRSLRCLACGERGCPEAAPDLRRSGGNPVDRRGDDGLVPGKHRQSGHRKLRPGPPCCAGGSTRGNRRRYLPMGGSPQASLGNLMEPDATGDPGRLMKPAAELKRHATEFACRRLSFSAKFFENNPSLTNDAQTIIFT